MLSPDWLPTIIEVVAIGAGLAFFVSHWHVRNILNRIRFAKMLLADLVVVHAIFMDSKERVNSGKDVFMPLPKSGYEGLINSGGISYLSLELQNDVHLFYTYVDSYNRNFREGSAKPSALKPFCLGMPSVGLLPISVGNTLEKLIKSVEKFIKENECDKRWLLKLFRAYDGD